MGLKKLHKIKFDEKFTVRVLLTDTQWQAFTQLDQLYRRWIAAPEDEFKGGAYTSLRHFSIVNLHINPSIISCMEYRAEKDLHHINEY